MKVGDKVYCKDDFGEFTGWISSIEDSNQYPYIVVEDREDIGKTFIELSDESNGVFEVYELESLTSIQDLI